MNITPPPRRVWVEINLAILCANYGKIAAAVAPARVMAVLKANAYGLGAQPIAAALAGSGVERFGVAEPYEALSLTALGLPVQILGSILPEELPSMVAAGVVLPVTDLATALQVQAEGARQNRRVKVHFKIDTGMGRLGIRLPEARDVIRQAVQLPNIEAEGIYSHFPVAYRAGEIYTQRQIDGFLALLNDLTADGIAIPLRHMANSDAINNFPHTARSPFNLVRTGINLHGSFDTEGRRVLQLLPVLAIKTRLTAVRRLPAGTAIGYGLTHRLARETPVGTISAGYADGLPLALSNRGYVLIRGVPCPVLGRISMDYTTVSLDQVPDAAVGDEVVCLGGEGPQAISVEDWANLKGTHSYDIICSIGTRVERRYL
ncbi:MAG: alanine racemase [bacterium]